MNDDLYPGRTCEIRLTMEYTQVEEPPLGQVCFKSGQVWGCDGGVVGWMDALKVSGAQPFFAVPKEIDFASTLVEIDQTDSYDFGQLIGHRDAAGNLKHSWYRDDCPFCQDDRAAAA